MYKRISFLVLGIVLVLCNASAFADSATITHTQQTTKTESMAGFSACGVDIVCTTTVTITVTNNTGIAWSDYHIRFVNAIVTDSIVKITNVSFQPGNPFSSAAVVKNDVVSDGKHRSVITFSKGSVPQGATFTVVIDIQHIDSVNVFGRPSFKKAARD